MRNVLKPGEVFHYFANKVQPSGWGGNTSFALPNAYSYAAIIGRHYPQGVALASGTWSPTTTNHQSDLRRACSNLTRVYVPDPASVDTSYRAVNIEVAALLRKACTAKARRDSYLSEALSKVQNFNTFAMWCDSPLRIEPPVTDPEALKAIAQSVKVETAARNAAIKERARLDSLDNAAKLQAWRDGAPVYLPYGLPVALRINGDTIETTNGARIPVTECPLIWAMVTRGRDWKPGATIGVYQLTKIRANGSIVVDCHDIEFSELAYIADKLGYAPCADI